MNQVLSDLRAARALVADQSRWTTGALARNRGGFPCCGYDRGAVSFCSLGAIERTAGENIHRMIHAVEALQQMSPWRCGNQTLDVATVNDSMGHDAVLKMFDHVIAILEDEAAQAEGARICRLLTAESVYPEANHEVACAV